MSSASESVIFFKGTMRTKRRTPRPAAPRVITRYLSTHYGSLSPGAPIQNGHVLHLYMSGEKRTITGTFKRLKEVHGGSFAVYTICRIVRILQKFKSLRDEKTLRRFQAFCQEYIHISKYLAIKVEPETSSPGTESGSHDSGQRE